MRANSKLFLQKARRLWGKVLPMILYSETVRELPASPVFFGLFAFGVLALLLYLTLRMDRD
ncbi:hypothetical protein MCEMKE157_00940 [actinobacterium SCGC AAA044-D11]|jgi:hypothetical protein